MNLAELPAESIAIGLRAMQTVAAANGVFDEAEKALIEAAGRAMGIEIDASALEPIEPDVVARAIEDPLWRERLVQALVVTALIDGEATKDEVAVVDRFAT